jgi:hypothetical protein
MYAFTQNKKTWNTNTGPERYRRALYTMFFRSAPYPLFSTFDAPDFQSVCTRRNRSDTPLQALTMANDAAFFEIAQGLAARVLREVPAPSSDEARIARAFVLCLCRPPSKKERAILVSYGASEVARLSRDPQAAAALMPNGSTIPSPQAAAMVSVARAILNTDSFITRE